MGIFDVSIIDEEDRSFRQELVEAMLVDDLLSLPSDQLKSFVESDEAKALVEAKALSKPTLVRLSKKDDESRRVKLAAYEICKKENKALWDKFCKAQAKKKFFSKQIMDKYEARARREARLSQKAYIKAKGNLPKDFGGAVR